MAYSGEDLFRNYRKTYVIAPFQASQVSPNGYDLRVGHALTLDFSDPDSRPGVLEEMSYRGDGATGRGQSAQVLTVGPGQSLLVVTVEQIFLSSKVLATVHAKASVSMQGLLLNPVTVDPNFAAKEEASGRLVLFMHNLSGRTIQVEEKQGIATLIMHEVFSETMHPPDKNGFEDVLTAVQSIYDKTVVDSLTTYTNFHKESRGRTEFFRDREAVQNYRKAMLPR